MTEETKANYVKRLRNRENIQRIIVYGGQKVCEHIQLNKTTPFICWQRFIMPTNRDKSRAVKHNECLSLKEVLRLLSNDPKVDAVFQSTAFKAKEKELNKLLVVRK